MKDPLYKVSSTLNPQAPEFILSCQPTQKALPTAIADIPDGADFNSVDCADSEASALDSQQACSDLDMASGSLGQRERKKKKKRPPGYYNYLEGSSNSGGTAVDGAPGSGLVNGHTLSASALASEDMVGEALPGVDLSPAAPLDSTPSTALAAPAPHQRTCDSPDESSLDLTSGAASFSDGNAAASSSSSSSSSQSSGLVEGARTAEQHTDPLALESPELPGSGGHSPCPTSQPPPSATVVTIATATTDKGQPEGTGQANGLPEANPADGATDKLLASPETGEAQSGSVLVLPSSDSEAQSAAEQASSPTPAAASVANPPKSWASLFHNSKPLPGGPQAYVEVKNVPAVVAVSPAATELPEKVCEVQEGPVCVSEDPMAPKLAGMGSTPWGTSVVSVMVCSYRSEQLF